MKKNIVLLTTKTSHHFYFINEISKICNLFIIFENNILRSDFNIKSVYEKKQFLYEKQKWFDNKQIKIKKQLKFLNTNNINSIKTVNFINFYNPNIIFSFGISRLKKDYLNKINRKIYNFHGGDTSFYRGLDSHLWSLYHKDKKGMKVTLHEVDAMLDAGKIAMIKKLKLNKINELYQLRSITTEMCVLIAKKVIKKTKIYSKKPNKIGRYYSFMPKDLKAVVSKSFKKLIYDH